MKKVIAQIKMNGHVYELDASDLDGREAGLLDRWRAEYGENIGAMYALALIARRRAGEQVTEDEMLTIKLRDLVLEEGAARPPADAASSG